MWKTTALDASSRHQRRRGRQRGRNDGGDVATRTNGKTSHVDKKVTQVPSEDAAGRGTTARARPGAPVPPTAGTRTTRPATGRGPGHRVPVRQADQVVGAPPRAVPIRQLRVSPYHRRSPCVIAVNHGSMTQAY
jgi:hypothetical protein